MVTDIRILQGYQSCQLVKNHQCFREHLCPHHQGKDVTIHPHHPTDILTKSPCLNMSISQREVVGAVKCLLSLAFLPDCCIYILRQHVHHRAPELTDSEATVLWTSLVRPGYLVCPLKS